MVKQFGGNFVILPKFVGNNIMEEICDHTIQFVLYTSRLRVVSCAAK